MATYTNIFGGAVVSPAPLSYRSYTTAVPLSLNWPTTFIDSTNVIADIIDINPTAGGVTITLPDATQVSVGTSILFANKTQTANTFIVRNNAAANLFTAGVGTLTYIYLTDNTTAAGTWTIGPFAGGVAPVTSVGLTSTSNNLVVGGTPSPITTVGTFQLSLANDLLALSTFGASTGLTARTAANTWALRTLTGTVNQIVIANPAGVAGNPTFSLANDTVIANSLTVGAIQIGGGAGVNVITSLNGNNMQIFPTGGGTTLALAADGGVFIQSTGSSPLSIITTGGIRMTAQGGGAGPISIVTGITTAAATYTLPITLPTINGQVMKSTTAGIMSWGTYPDYSSSTVVANVNPMVAFIGYIANSAGLLTFTLPAVFNVGDYFIIDGLGAGGWTIAQNAGQTIFFSGGQTTVGVGGSLASASRFDSVRLKAIVANTTLTAVAFDGALVRT